MDKPFHHLARAIIIKDGKVLLAQAKGYKNTFLPGGHIEFGESAKDALIRELAEELGLKCEVSQFLGLVEHKWEKRGVLHCEINQVFEVNCSELHSDTSPIAEEGHLEFFWADSTQLESLQPYPFRKLIQAKINGIDSVWWESTLNNEIDENNRS